MPTALILALALSVAQTAEPVTTAPAETLRRLHAPEARQGVAVDADHVYAIDNGRIRKYDRHTGHKVGGWIGDPAMFPHLNSCARVEARLVCASSNYPSTPMTSSVEMFDPATMIHTATVPRAPAPAL